jgi:hypothetical protein
VLFDLTPAHIRGRDAGLLRFDFACLGSQATPTIAIYWAEAGADLDERSVVRFPAADGAVIVPLDAAPRWLLSKNLGALRIDVADPAPCVAFTLRNIVLAQRKEVDETDSMLSGRTHR